MYPIICMVLRNVVSYFEGRHSMQLFENRFPKKIFGTHTLHTVLHIMEN